MTSKLRPTAAKKKTRAGSMARDLAAMLRREVDKLKGAQWPSEAYQKDPVGFVRDVLHETPLPHQIAILESARDNFKVAVRSGQKTGKTKLVIWLALWFYCSFPGARVFMVAAVAEQVKRVLWFELKNTLRHAKKHGFEMPEIPAENPATGLCSEDGREIKGFTVRDIEAMAGLSGHILAIVDEASALSADLAQAIEGNLAGADCRMIWISNPTRTEGPFFDAFNNPEKGAFWKLYHLNSEKVAAYCDRMGLAIPGVANLRRIATWAEEWKRDSPFFIVRVLGEFLKNETGRCISFQDVTDAQNRWDGAEDDGPLSIGIDPAGPGDEGDEFAFAIVRGTKLLALFTFRGLTEDAAWAHLKSFLASYRRGSEIPTVVVDSEGAIGSSVYYKLKGISETLRRKRPDLAFECYGVKSSHNAKREPMIYERVREELWANCANWLKTGAILKDHKLAEELHAPMWVGTLKAKLKATPKNELREKLGRSPDRADALCLAVWTPSGKWERRSEEEPDEPDTIGVSFEDDRSDGIDPYNYGL